MHVQHASFWINMDSSANDGGDAMPRCPLSGRLVCDAKVI